MSGDNMMSPAVFGSWTGQEPEKPEVTVPAGDWDEIDRRMAEVCAWAVAKFGFVPTCINPDGTPRRKGEAT